MCVVLKLLWMYCCCFRCFDDRQYKQAVGIALETRRIDVFREAILKSVLVTFTHPWTCSPVTTLQLVVRTKWICPWTTSVDRDKLRCTCTCARSVRMLCESARRFYWEVMLHLHAASRLVQHGCESWAGAMRDRVMSFWTAVCHTSLSHGLVVVCHRTRLPTCWRTRWRCACRSSSSEPFATKCWEF